MVETTIIYFEWKWLGISEIAYMPSLGVNWFLEKQTSSENNIPTYM